MKQISLFNGQHFNGPVYEPMFDQQRLGTQIERVHGLMIDGVWRTLAGIAAITHDPESSISAQLRHLRKKRFGLHVVHKKPKGERENGLWQYQLHARASFCAECLAEIQGVEV